MIDAGEVARARDGDAEARESIAAALRDRLERFAVTMLGDPHSAEDVAQDTLDRALDRLAELRSDDRFIPWAFSIAVNLCRTELRRRVNREVHDPEPEAALDEARRTVLSSIVRREDAALLAVAVDNLPVTLREAFVLRHVDGMAYADMEEALGAAEHTLHVRCARARTLLKTRLGKVVDTWWGEGP